MNPAAHELDVEGLELELLLEAMFRRYGADFRGYARSSLRRRIRNMVRDERLGSISALQEKILREPEAMVRLLDHLSVCVTSMFRDPSFFLAFRQKVVPHLFSAPFVRIWCAGAATGEEVYSLAILLSEEGLFERCRLYGTDINAHLIEKARRGVFDAALMGEYEANYRAAGGKGSLSDYFRVAYDGATPRHGLKRNILFAQHNLAIDGSFNEFNVILCRNVMIYFGAELQNRVHELFFQSLRRKGFLCLGRRESLPRALAKTRYETVDAEERIYRRRS
ncbi:MAG: protein-glutamate O-methyltransferase CheR [Myxococcaceae bacterium]|nr:protein-glutamate O-methyltransferase CheR [Myxococcaceae bacterium]